eukprot:Lithocolla_globosa_v1_NODE_165_length_5553_cov_13.632479.p7 type:complete len:114 gc:universal NODE_165_length_5553_cov_13.632479:2171-1830(-)
MEKLLHELYYNPKTGFSSNAVLYKRAKAKWGQQKPAMTKKFVSDWLAKQRTEQLHKPARKAKSPGFIAANFLNERWQADVDEKIRIPLTSLQINFFASIYRINIHIHHGEAPP